MKSLMTFFHVLEVIENSLKILHMKYDLYLYMIVVS